MIKHEFDFRMKIDVVLLKKKKNYLIGIYSSPNIFTLLNEGLIKERIR